MTKPKRGPGLRHVKQLCTNKKNTLNHKTLFHNKIVTISDKRRTTSFHQNGCEENIERVSLENVWTRKVRFHLSVPKLMFQALYEAKKKRTSFPFGSTPLGSARCRCLPGCWGRGGGLYGTLEESQPRGLPSLTREQSLLEIETR